MDIKINPFVRRNKKGKLARVKAFSRRMRKRVGSKPKPKRDPNVIGEGKNGRVVKAGIGKVRKEMTGYGRAKKVLLLRKDEASIQKRAASLKIAPKVYKTSKDGAKITMERVKGETLERKLSKTKSPKAQKSIGVSTGKTFKTLHDNQIIHGDSHLENIYATDRKGKKIKIIDYGLAGTRNRPLKKSEKLKDYKKLHKRSAKYPKFQEGFREGYGQI
jgi:tRNA A-37 threonylcarbamoyl transferase component Bud32